MADATTDTAGEGLESRPPSASDLASLCRGDVAFLRHLLGKPSVDLE